MNPQASASSTHTPSRRRLPGGLAARLTLGFAAVALLAIGTVAVLANRAAARSFSAYLAADEAAAVAELQADLTRFYAANGSWDGVESVLRAGGWVRGQGRGAGGRFVQIVDAAGRPVLPTAPGPVAGEAEGATYVFEVTVDGAVVGTVTASPPGQDGAAVSTFLAQVNRSLWWSAAAAVGLAVLLGLGVAGLVVRPLRALQRATGAIARGDLTQRVPVEAGGEVGQLAARFNAMSAALETAETQRRQMLADIAHDLNTPISVIQSHLEAMLDGVFEVSADELSLLHEETLRLGRLVDDVRTLSLADAGRLPLERRALDLGALVQRACDAFAPLAEEDGVALAFERPETPVVVSADPLRLHQLLGNLLSNALRHAPQGVAAPPMVRVVLAVDDRRAHVAVTDSGPGLSAEQQARIFDRFWRGDAARGRTTSGTGSGLGLAIARGLAEAHGGALTVASTPGAGATFTLVLPLL